MMDLRRMVQHLMGQPDPVVNWLAQLGYAGTGRGGTVVQGVSKATAVTLNKITGQITMNAANLAAGAIVTFTLNNSQIVSAASFLHVNHISAGTVGSYLFSPQCTGAGTANITVTNITAGGLAEAIVLQYYLFNLVTA